ncbi:MAG: hypothetical protein JXX28_06175 [Deltaproteobacteria bacterium]|nr:hypothetical protein [Deltaproteobacteria bacterium]
MQGLYGDSLAQQGELAAARPVFDRALSLEPLQPQVRHALGVLALAEEDANEADALWLEEVRLFSTALPALVTLYAEQGRDEERLVPLEAIRELEPPNHLTLHSQAQALFNLHRYEDANAAVSVCMETAPDYPACAMRYANVLDKLGRKEEAVEAYHLALALREDALRRGK